MSIYEMTRNFQCCVLVALFAVTNAEDFDPTATSLSVGSILFLISLVGLCYYCCRRRNKVPMTFERFSNESSANQRQPPPRKKRFFGRGRNPNQTVNVVIHPILPPSEPPQRIQVGPAPTAPVQQMVHPPYNRVHHGPTHGAHLYGPPQMGTNDHVSPLSTLYR